ncbi:Hypothetical predicted protein [Mytilus galloprovincialis]|uniref:Uncharacterized protein n=1 Tax=Mytilus galloprovincialis TaxID=29158 RepID=A0A8B6C7C2_MYTGA|nr:Hypothetical predicted protein [Mytilus galloprovincialis]
MDPKSPIDSLSPLTIEIPSAGPQRLANSLPDFDGRSHTKSGFEIEISVDEPRTFSPRPRAENENYFRFSRENEAPSTRIHTRSAARQPRRQVDTDIYDIGQAYNNQQSQVYEPTGCYRDRHSPLPRFDPLFNYNRNAPLQYAYSRDPFQRDLSQHMLIYGPPRPAAYVPQGYTSGLRATFITRREKEPDKFDGRSVDWKDFIACTL